MDQSNINIAIDHASVTQCPKERGYFDFFKLLFNSCGEL